MSGTKEWGQGNWIFSEIEPAGCTSYQPGLPIASATLKEFTLPMSDGEVEKQGRALHGLRHTLLPWADGLSDPQPDSRLERPRLPGRLGQRDPQPPFDEPTSPTGRAESARRPAEEALHAEFSRTSR